MKLILENSYPLDKCYALTSLYFQGTEHLVVAAEKRDKCLLFDLEGNLEQTIWEQPGGTMSLVAVPNKDGWFLATQQMYSPNDALRAKIVLVRPKEANDWTITTLAEVPFAHRFDILKSGDTYYLVICTIKSGHNYKDDWTQPGQILACELPANWSWIDEGKPISFTLVAENLLRNHGYWKGTNESGDYCVIGADNGVFKVVPPSESTKPWEVSQLLAEPTSDIAFVDFDGDGKNEMITLSPFHGDTIRIYSLQENQYQLCYEYPKKVGFVHSIWAGYLDSKPYAIIGHRQGDRDILGLSYDGTYRVEILANDVGSTNVLCYDRKDKHYLLSANREINTIAFYRIEV